MLSRDAAKAGLDCPIQFFLDSVWSDVEEAEGGGDASLLRELVRDDEACPCEEEGLCCEDEACCGAVWRVLVA